MVHRHQGKGGFSMSGKTDTGVFGVLVTLAEAANLKRRADSYNIWGVICAVIAIAIMMIVQVYQLGLWYLVSIPFVVATTALAPISYRVRQKLAALQAEIERVEKTGHLQTK